MNYEIQYDEEAIKYLHTLEMSLKNRIFTKIESTKQNPFRYFKKLSGRSEYKLRVGDYRIIADIEGTIISIRLIGHRRNVYK